MCTSSRNQIISPMKKFHCSSIDPKWHSSSFFIIIINKAVVFFFWAEYERWIFGFRLGGWHNREKNRRKKRCVCSPLRSPTTHRGSVLSLILYLLNREFTRKFSLFKYRQQFSNNTQHKTAPGTTSHRIELYYYHRNAAILYYTRTSSCVYIKRKERENKKKCVEYFRFVCCCLQQKKWRERRR